MIKMVLPWGLELTHILIFTSVLGFFVAVIALNWVNRSVGIKFAIQLFRMSKKQNKKKILLKIWLTNGRPIYQIHDVANVIEYTYKENGKDKIGMVKYDLYAKYEEFAGVPILECDPNDILPRNPFVNTPMNLSGELLKKQLIDNAKTDFGREEFKKWAKLALPILAVAGIIIILYSSNQGEQIAALSADLAQCYAQIPREVIVNG